MSMIKKVLLIFLILLLGIWCYVIEPRMLEVNKITIQDSELKGIKIVFASDFHIKPYGQKRLDMIVEKINAENPDKDFMPCPGEIEGYIAPGGFGVRVDSDE